MIMAENRTRVVQSRVKSTNEIHTRNTNLNARCKPSFPQPCVDQRQAFIHPTRKPCFHQPCLRAKASIFSINTQARPSSTLSKSKGKNSICINKQAPLSSTLSKRAKAGVYISIKTQARLSSALSKGKRSISLLRCRCAAV